MVDDFSESINLRKGLRRRRSLDSPPLAFLAWACLVALLYVGRPIFLPILIAACLYFLLAPFVRKLAAVKVPRILASALTTLIFTAAVGMVTTALVQPASTWVESAPRHLSRIQAKLEFVKQPLERLSEASEQVEDLAAFEKRGTRDVELDIKDPVLTQTIFQVTGNALISTASVLVLLFFMLAFADQFFQKLRILYPTMSFLGEVETSISRYLLTIAIINVCLGIAIGSAMWLYGLPSPILWGTLAAALNFLPYIGGLIGCVIVFLVSLVTFESPLLIVFPALTYFVINTLEGQFITPMILGSNFRLNPLIILLSMMILGGLLGIGGVFIALPLLIALRLFFSNSPKYQRLGILMDGSQPAPTIFP